MASLLPFPGNARRGDIPRLRESLREHGQVQALLVRRTPAGDTVLSGNQTLIAMQEEGIAEAECKVIECGETQALKINIVMNRTADLAVNDEDALVALLTELDGDYLGSGYTFDDHQDLLALLGHLDDTDVPSLDDLAKEAGDPVESELWPVLRFKVPPNVRDDFYTVTDPCGEFDDVHRFMYLVKKAQGA